MSQSFAKNLSSEVLPAGKMYYNIADRILNSTSGKNYELISDYTKYVQTKLNREVGLNIKAINPSVNQGKIDGIVNRIAMEDNYDDIAWILDEPVVNFSQSVVDDIIKANADFHNKLGLKPKIERISTGKCCDWCNALAGTYTYPDIPKDIYRRHRFCRCTVEYNSGDGKIQNVHTKKWLDPEKETLRNFRISQSKNIIHSKIEHDKKEAQKIRRILSSELIDKEINWIKIKEVSDHISERMLQRGLKPTDLINSINNPLDISGIKYDTESRPSFKVIGEKATFYVNPENGTITTIHKTSSKKVKKLKGEEQ